MDSKYMKITKGDFKALVKGLRALFPTKASLGISKVEDKSSADIRGELTAGDVTSALGYAPPRQDTTYRTVGDFPAS